MPMHRFRNGFWIWRGGGGGGGAHTFARLKCVWARNVFERQRNSLTLDKIIQFLQLVLCYGVKLSLGPKKLDA